MPQTSLADYVEALDKAGLLTRYTDEKRVDQLPMLMEQNPNTSSSGQPSDATRLVNGPASEGVEPMRGLDRSPVSIGRRQAAAQLYGGQASVDVALQYLRRLHDSGRWQVEALRPAF
jgi:hypothetical protein